MTASRGAQRRGDPGNAWPYRFPSHLRLMARVQFRSDRNRRLAMTASRGAQGRGGKQSRRLMESGCHGSPRHTVSLHEPSPSDRIRVQQVVDLACLSLALGWIAASAAPPRNDVIARPAGPWRSRKCLAMPFSVPPPAHGPCAIPASPEKKARNDGIARRAGPWRSRECWPARTSIPPPVHGPCCSGQAGPGGWRSRRGGGGAPAPRCRPVRGPFGLG